MGLKLDVEASRRLTEELLLNEFMEAQETLTGMGVPRHDDNGDELTLCQRMRWLFLNHDDGDV